MYAQLLLCLLLLRTVTLTDVTYYEILGVSKQASAQEIRQAYKKLAIKLHPDKNPNSSEQEKFLKITEAYETLKDPDKRHKYDVYGSYPSYTRKYDYHSQSEYNNLYYNGLYHGDAFVDTLSGGSFYSYLQEGFHFINFYSPFCPPCQNLADHWKKLALIYKGIIKVGAVNCKYYNSFCYNTMRIASYPTLLFYPNGKNGNFVYYRGDRTLDALDQFVMTYLRSQVHLPTLTHIRNVDSPMAYVMGRNRIEDNGLLRIAYHLKGLVTLAIVEEDSLRAKLTKNDYTTVVFKYKGTTKEIESTEEKEVLKEIVDTMPKIEMIEPDKLKKIRNKLLSGDETPWVLFFSSKGQDKLLLHQMRIKFSDMHFGEVNCDKWAELCASLQVESPPAWGVLKPGGAYQLIPPAADVRAYIRTAVSAARLHSLSASDLTKITNGDMGTWVLLVVPYQLSWDHLVDPFTKASLHYVESDDVSFGIMVCNLNTDKHCRQLALNEPAILVQDGAKRHAYRGEIRTEHIIEFIELIKDSAELELTESEVIEVMGNSNRQQTWVIAFFPAHCGRLCDQLLLEWRKVAAKLRPLQAVRAGSLQCAGGAGGAGGGGLCANVRAPVARLYPRRSQHHYSVNLQQLSQAPYMLEWALQYIDNTIQQLDWHAFSRLVAAEELHPTGGKKPWLVYFHSPRCYRCYEMYADFAVAGALLNNAVNLGKVNCLNERGLCQNEQVNSYPSLKLYLNRNRQQQFSSIISIPVKDYASLLQEIKPHLMRYDANLLAEIDEMGARSEFHIRHDEF